MSLPQIVKVTDKHFIFECGCFVEHNQYIPFIDFDNINKCCDCVWEVLSQGKTRGIFQLENGSLGVHWSKEMKCKSIDDVSVLIALVRPGVLESRTESGESTAKAIIKRRNKECEIEYMHPSLEPILGETYGEIIFQESAIRLAQDIAGFNPNDAETLRKCVTGDTYFVSKQRGFITINELLKTGYNKDLFLSMNYEGVQSWKPIKEIWFSGKKTVDKIQTRTGLSIKATKNHQFLTDNGWKARQRLKSEQDYMVCTRNIDFDGFDEFPKDLYIIIAGLLTEGYCSLNKKPVTTFTNHDKKVMDTFRQACLRYFGRLPKLDKKEVVCRLNVEETNFLSSKMKYVLSVDKEIPDFMMGATLETTKSFLSFMYCGECSISKPRADIEFSSKSEKMIDQIKLLLLRFGIISNKLKKFNKKYQQFYHRLYICDRKGKQKFKEFLSEHIQDYKLERLNSHLQEGMYNGYTIDSFPRSIIDKFLNQFPGIGFHDGINEGGSLYTGTTLSRDKFQKLADITKNKYWKDLSNGEQSYDRLESVEYFGKEIDTYDFTMEDENVPYLVANGIVIHNSIGKKDTSLMAGLKDKFINGCTNTKIVDETIARKLFENIEKSQRYSFNKCLSKTSTIYFTDGKSETVEALFDSGAWRGRKSYSLRFWPRIKPRSPQDNILKNSEVVENEIEDIQYAGEQYVYRITLKRRKIADNEYYGKPNRPHFSITVTGSHKHPTRCHGEVRTDELKEGLHSLYAYDPMQAYRPKYKHAASKIIKIERLGKERVYDVTMKAPYHNFLADGVFTCNSHSVGYGTQTYITAWTKTHFPLEFYTSNLRLNEERGGKKEKLLEEKSNMIKEAASFGIHILPPSMSFPCREFSIKDEHTIYYGISNIKMTGDKEAETTLNWLKEREGEEIKWLDVLFGLGETLKSASFENLCLAGFFNLPITRQGMVYEYKTYRKLTAKEVDWIRGNKHQYSDLKEGLSELVQFFKDGGKGGISRKDRVSKIEDLIKTLENPPHSLEDTPITINRNEKELLGVALTYSDLEARMLCGIQANTTCKELNEGKTGKELTVVVSLTKVKEHKAKGGMMAFLAAQDGEDNLESIVVFSNIYSEYSNLLFEKNTVILQGSSDKKSFIVNKVTQI